MAQEKVKRALISVSDKTGLAEFAKELSANRVEIISSGGTFDALKKAGIKSVKVEDMTNFPEMLDGRVKTLHPKIHGGILAIRNKGHLAQLKKHNIEPIDLVVVNLYPFARAISNPKVSLEDAIENIDIGGPALIRAAAKNHEYVGVVVDPAQYKRVLEDLKENSFSFSEKMKKELMVEAYRHTAFYDSLVSNYFAQKYGAEKFPEKLTVGLSKISGLRYGENPHQKAVLYRNGNAGGIIDAKQLNGKELSYNNYFDIDSALQIVKEFDMPAAAIVKHANPCGVAQSGDISTSFKLAFECDPLSAFGGIIALNRKCDLKTAQKITSFFNEVVVAPSYETAALEELRKKKNLRILEMPPSATDELQLRQIDGGMLAQEKDKFSGIKFEAKTDRKATKSELTDLEFAWKVAKNVKSNAIVIAKGNATIGIGGGLPSRVDATELAIKKAGIAAKGAVLASDAFFPFKDSVDAAAKAGIAAIVQPGGSLNDPEVIRAAKSAKVAMYFTGERHFRH